jgi:hypothetical protein
MAAWLLSASMRNVKPLENNDLRMDRHFASRAPHLAECPPNERANP